METEGRHVSCCSCGKEVECASGQPPCEALQGWLTVSRWQGSGAVEHRNFCSFDCLRSWIDTQSPEVPEIFLESFEEGES